MAAWAWWVVATHVGLQERVAFKFLLPEIAKNADALGRFFREARATAQLESEHVVRVRDVTTLSGGVPMIVMEYLEGQDLEKALEERGRLAVREAVSQLLQACDALAEAHALGMVHRDLKPGNLFAVKRRDGTTGGTGGASPSGGNSGTAGAPSGGAGPLLIDDFANGDSKSLLPGAAPWASVTDSTATGTMSVDFKAGATGEVHVVGEGFNEWGADLVLPLTVSSGGVTPSFDASAFAGIELRVKRSSATATKELRVSVATTDTVPGGGICAADGCYDTYTAPLTLTDDLQTVRVPFATLKQAGFAQPLVALRLTELREIALRSGAGKSFDFSVDQVSFYR